MIDSFITELCLELPFVIGAFSCFIASLGAYVLIRNRQLILLTIGSFFITISLPSCTLTWAPYMENLGANEFLLGIASSIFMAMAGLGSYVGGKLTRNLGFKKIVIMSLISMSTSFFSLFFIKNPYIFIITALPFEIGFGMIRPALSAWINKYIPSEERATVISLRKTLMLPFSALGMAIMGFLSGSWSPRLAFLFGFIMITSSTLIYIKVSEN